MKSLVGVFVGLSVAAGVLGGCTLCENLDCDPGGGGIGNGDFSFSRGIVFIRDGDIFAADESDFTTAEPLTSGGSFQRPGLSPDGRAVVAATRNGSQLVRVSLAGSASTLLQEDATFQNLREPVFTPNGQSVVFVFDSGAQSCIGRVAADGSGGAETLLGCSGAFPSYASPSFDEQGRLLVAAGSFGNLNSLELWNLTTNSRVRTFSSLGNATRVASRAVLSPDGKLVAFDGVTASGALRLFTVSSSGGTPVQLPIGAGNHTFPSWKGNTALVFASDEGGGDAAYLVDLSSSSAELVVPSAEEPTYGPN
ncbi:MAG: hypothetical protein L0Y66_06970 [Myxococcaceae bacterium]|nr:hypothetical protein [Myxococcaceae bacterium]